MTGVRRTAPTDGSLGTTVVRGYARGRATNMPSDWVAWFLARSAGARGLPKNVLIRTRRQEDSQADLWRVLDLVKSAPRKDRGKWLEGSRSDDWRNLTGRVRYVRRASVVYRVLSDLPATRRWLDGRLSGCAPARWPDRLLTVWNMPVPPTPWEFGAFLSVRAPTWGWKWVVPFREGYYCLRWWLIGMTVDTLSSALGVEAEKIREQMEKFLRWYRSSYWFFWQAASGWAPMFENAADRERLLRWLDGRLVKHHESQQDVRWLNGLTKHPYWKVACLSGYAGDVRLRSVYWPWYYPAAWSEPTGGLPDYALRVRIVDWKSRDAVYEGLVDRKDLMGSRWRSSAWSAVPRRKDEEPEEEGGEE